MGELLTRCCNGWVTHKMLQWVSYSQDHSIYWYVHLPCSSVVDVWMLCRLRASRAVLCHWVLWRVSCSEERRRSSMRQGWQLSMTRLLSWRLSWVVLPMKLSESLFCARFLECVYTVWRLHHVVYSVWCTVHHVVYSVWCTVHHVIFSVWCTVHHIIYSVPCTPCYIQCMMYSTCHIQYTMLYTVCDVQYTMLYTVCDVQYTMLYAVGAIQYTMLYTVCEVQYTMLYAVCRVHHVICSVLCTPCYAQYAIHTMSYTVCHPQTFVQLYVVLHCIVGVDRLWPILHPHN